MGPEITPKSMKIFNPAAPMVLQGGPEVPMVPQGVPEMPKWSLRVPKYRHQAPKIAIAKN